MKNVAMCLKLPIISLISGENVKNSYRPRIVLAGMKITYAFLYATADSSFSDQPDSVVVSLCNNVVNEGLNCRLTCAASGGNPQTYSYQWRFQYKFSSSYQAVSGETSSGLLLRSVSYTDAGSYQCVVSNAAGEMESDSILLDVNCKLINIFRCACYGRTDATTCVAR